MIDLEGSMYKPSRRSKHQALFEDEHDEMTDLASTMASVTEIDWESNVDSNVSAESTAPPYDKQCSSPSSNVAFFKAINARG